MEEQRKSENALVPALRFEGFSDPWEQRKVGDYLVESRERGSSGDVAKKLTVKLWGKGVTEKAEISGSAHTQYYVRHAGQFIYSKLDFLNAAFGVIPDNLDEYESTADLPAFDVSNLDARFLLLKATQRSFYLRYGTIADGSRKAKRIHSEAFLAMPLFVPDYIEQTRIATLFARLDSLIALHQRKHEKLKTVKQSLLEKMFPKEGEDVPEIRFEGFTDPWEQRKLGEICEGLSYGVGAAAVPFDGATRYLRITDIDDETHQFLEDDLSSPDPSFSLSDTDYLRPGEIVFARTGASVGKTYLNRDDAGDIVFAGFLIRAVLQEGNNPEFVYQQTLSESYKNYVAITSQRSGQPGVNAQEYSEWILWICDKDEQARIGALFQKFDSLIALHQRELDILKNLKQALLEKMFV
ncbi:restriction endonuclease subunit S [uncultured Adlercreutzia sp.]|uniref:restriction endonuclease subunit S n=1 Tax=uncultured Adlercreutzia sp. TaxID=875803 RepID=UPI00258811BD|nr:restriction endonuclease subunit S [uncultured Adlercreutzia sp.]